LHLKSGPWKYDVLCIVVKKGWPSGEGVPYLPSPIESHRNKNPKKKKDSDLSFVIIHLINYQNFAGVCP